MGSCVIQFLKLIKMIQLRKLKNSCRCGSSKTRQFKVKRLIMAKKASLNINKNYKPVSKSLLGSKISML